MDTWHWVLIVTNIAIAAQYLHSRFKLRKIQQALLCETSHRDRLERALDSAKMGTWDVDNRTGMITWSRYHEILFGYSPGTFDGSREAFRSRVHPEDLQKFLMAVSLSRKNRCEYSVEIRVIRPNGSTIWIQGRGMPYFDSEGVCIRTMGTIIEITERHLAEEKLISVMDDLRKANSVKDQFLSNISHDIRTPLSVVMGYADILLNEYEGKNALTREHEKFLLRIKENARQLLTKIDGVIQYIQADMSNFKVVRNRIHVNELLGSFSSGSRMSAKGKNVEIFSRLDSKEDLIVTDGFIVSTIIEQLIEYSLRNTDAEFIFLQAFIKKIDVDHGTLEITVKDNGRRPKDEPSIASFNLHVLQSTDPAADPGGLEVGLPLACKLATILSGSVTSTPAGEQSGSKFIVRLPINFPKATPQTQARQIIAKPDHSGEQTIN